jgi:hypothetical protein
MHAMKCECKIKDVKIMHKCIYLCLNRQPKLFEIHFDLTCLLIYRHYLPLMWEIIILSTNSLKNELTQYTNLTYHKLPYININLWKLGWY